MAEIDRFITEKFGAAAKGLAASWLRILVEEGIVTLHRRMTTQERRFFMGTTQLTPSLRLALGSLA